jgi:hypothetical protein
MHQVQVNHILGREETAGSANTMGRQWFTLAPGRHRRLDVIRHYEANVQ